MSAYSRRQSRALGEHADRVRAQAPRPEHVTPAARAVPGSFPAKFAKAVGVGCSCGRTIFKGEFVVKARGSVLHATCVAGAPARAAQAAAIAHKTLADLGLPQDAVRVEETPSRFAFRVFFNVAALEPARERPEVKASGCTPFGYVVSALESGTGTRQDRHVYGPGEYVFLSVRSR